MRVLLLFACLCSSPLAASAAATQPHILIVGDSISAGYGVTSERSWVGRLRARLEGAGYPYAVVNASISGDTTSGGLARLPGALARHQPQILVIELGGNDGLRGLPLDAMEANLRGMIGQAHAADARVLLLGIRLPPNYGSVYIERFTGVYRRLAEQTGVAFVPRLLEGVGERREWMQPDGIHPNDTGHGEILENVWPTLEPMLEKDTQAEPIARDTGSPIQLGMNHE